MNGWIKWHLQLIDNDLFREDWTAWHVFEYLCLMAYKGKPQGVVVTSRYKIANTIGGNHNTIYKAIKRLEKAKMVTISVTSKKTTIYICNWHTFQQVGNHSSNSSVTSEQPLGNTLIRIKNKNIDTNVSSRVSNETSTSVQKLYELYLQEFDTTEPRFKLTPGRRAKLGLRVKDAGYDLTAQAIRNTAASAWHRGENDRGWKANLDFIVRTYEQIERLAGMGTEKEITYQADW